MTWMIYGATGYTGRLIAQEAVARGMSPVLAGRGENVRELAEKLGLEARVFGLDAGAEEVARHLSRMRLVLHCAGPFSATSRPMLDACLRAKTHYLDITGEIDVFESVFDRSREIADQGIAAIPGVGFDVVPTDCLAAMLKRKLPEATRLTLAFRSDGGLSPGTAKSAVEGIAKGGRIRQGGKLTRVPIAARAREIDFQGAGRASHAVLSPWGDVATAYHSTGIPDIEFYIATPRRAILPMKIVARLMRNAGARAIAQRLIGAWVSGPEQSQRLQGRCWVWGEAVDAQGRTEVMRMTLPEGYRFTVISALECVNRVLLGDIRPGALTPSMAWGADFVLSLRLPDSRFPG